MRFKLDENLPVDLALLLSNAGYDAQTVAEEGYKGFKDSFIVDICFHEQRTFITFDLDFSDIRDYPPEKYFGLLVLRLVRQDTDHLVSVVQKIIPLLSQEKVRGKLWIIEEDRIRIYPQQSNLNQ